MAEYDRPDYLRQGHLFDTTPLRRDVWILLLIVLADRAYMELTEPEHLADGYAQHLLGLNAEFATDELSRILLSTSIALRVIDDRDDRILERLEACGELQPDVKSAARVPLSVREACNKIVHATKLNYDLARLDGGAVDQAGSAPCYMQPTIYLYGSHRGVMWRCVLDLVRFARGASIVL